MDSTASGTLLFDLAQQVLRTDASGMPLEWIDYRDAVRLYHTEQVAYTFTAAATDADLPRTG